MTSFDIFANKVRILGSVVNDKLKENVKMKKYWFFVWAHKFRNDVRFLS